MSRLPKFNDLKFTKKPSTRAPQYAKEDARRTVEVAKRLAQARIESLQRCVEQLIADGVDIDWADKEKTDFGWTGRVRVREPQAGESDHFFNYDPTASGWGPLKRIEELGHQLESVIAQRDMARAIADATGHSDLVAQRNRAVTDLASVKAELHRWQHGHQVEGDYVCPLMPDLDEANIVIERGAVALRAAQARIEELEAALRTSAELVGSFEAGIRLTQEVHSRTLAVALETMHAALGKVKP